MRSLTGDIGARGHRLRRYAVRVLGVLSLGTAALVVGPLAAQQASAQPFSLTLFPTTLTVPADGAMVGGITATVLDAGAPASGQTVTAVESGAPGATAGGTLTCTTDATGRCLLKTNNDGTTGETGTITASNTSCSGCAPTTSVHYTAPGNAPTGVSLALSGFTTNGPPGPAPGDTFSDNNHYFLSESDGSAGSFFQTTSQVKVAASLTGATGDAPWAIRWQIHNTGSNNVFLDAVSTVASLAGSPPTNNVLCQIQTQGKAQASPACTPGSFDLDQAAHFSNPASPSFDDLGAVNNTLPAKNTTITPNGNRTMTTYMTGALNNAYIVLDSGTDSPASVTVTAQVFNDPAGSTSDGGTNQGSASSTPGIVWATAPSGTSINGSLSAYDKDMLADSPEPDAAHDWVVVTNPAANPVVPQLVNFDQTGSQTYAANGTSVTETAFEGDITGGTFPTFGAANYGAANQANSLTSAAGPPPPPAPRGGYWMVASDGGIFAFHDASFFGSMGGQHLNQPMVGIAPTRDALGYWTVAADGGIFSFGDAAFHGSMGGTHLNQPMVGMASPDLGGYWTVASDGGIFAFGDAQFFGSTGNIHLNKPVVGMAPTPDGQGYWLVASDGGIFAYGDAQFFGSTGNIHLNKPVVGMAATSTGNGYWLVASDGGVFAFGDAQFYGSTGNIHLNQPVVGMSIDPLTGGYWMVASDGGIFAFNAPFFGSMGGTPLNKPVVAMGSTGI